MKKVTNNFDETYDAVVIGSGMGGLSCAAFLAKSGMTVKVFEQHSMAGGYCTSFTRKTFKFSAAVLYVNGCGPDGELDKIFSELGLRDQIQFRKIEPFCRLVLPGYSFTIPTSFDEWEDTLSREFPSEREGIKSFSRVIQAVAMDMKRGVPYPERTAKYERLTLEEMMNDFIGDHRLKVLIAGVFYGGLPPSRFSALSWCALMNTRLADSAYVPIGGPQAMADVLRNGVERFGGQLELDMGVRKILVDNGRAVGIETNDGRRVNAHFVVSNIAARQTFGGLISQREVTAVAPDFLNSLGSLEIGLSSMTVHLGIDMDLKSLGISDFHTIVHQSWDLEKEWEAAAQGNLSEAFFSLCIPTLLDPSLAPPNKHIIHIFTFAPYYLPGGNWSKEEKARLADVLISKAEHLIPDISRHIMVREAATPRTNERYTLNTEGVTAGWANSPTNMFGRPNPKTPINGLYLTGHWTRPGGSIRSVTVSGRAVAQMILGKQ